LAPVEGITAQTQRDHFAKQLAKHFGTPTASFVDWSDAFSALSNQLESQTAIVLFDEISWMGIEDPTFIPKLQVWWDNTLAHHPHVILIFCGSISTWIEENILNSTAFFGRITLTLTLEPLSLRESAQFLQQEGFKGSVAERCKLLSILGGIPWYLELIDPHCMAEKNIQQLCFRNGGLLVTEFDRIFHDLFNGKGTLYKKILNALKSGMKTLAEVREAIKYPESGTLSTYMEHLITCGFVSQHAHWSIKTESLGKQSLYRICDPYVRFYLKVIEPMRWQIEQGNYQPKNVGQIVGFDTHLGLQFEQLLLQNRALLLEAIGVQVGDLLFDGPYRQTKTSRVKGCQIDYLVQTKARNLFLCEFKFKRHELGSEVIEEVRSRMDRFSLPRGYALVPVLFHVGGVSAAVLEQRFFYRIVDVSDFLDLSI
jgi:hypothetical protein